MAVNDPDVLTFDGWAICIGSRELTVRGAELDVETKVFDLLALLIAERHRVVPRNELLELVWGRADVSDNVVARTVMKARKAIGDAGGGSELIRTVHRVGYRFTGEPLSPVEPKAAGPLLRLGLLPVENLTGDVELRWLEHGLAALIGQALDADGRLSVASVGAVARALAAAGDAGLEPPGRIAERLLGLHCVVATSIRRLSDAYRIDYRLLGSRGQGMHGTLTGSEPTELGQRLADRIEDRLFPDEAASVRFQSADAYANQTFARAVQAYGEERWQSAAKLLQVVLDMEPQSMPAACHYLAVLAALYDPTAFVLGERLLQQAHDAGDARMAATVHHALGQAHLNIHGPGATVSRHMDEALRLAVGHSGSDWALRLYTTQARHAQMSRDYARARELYEQAARDSEAAGNRIELAKIMNNRAVIDALTGNLLSARQWMEESLRISEELHLDSNIVASGGNLAEANAELGFIGKAEDLCDRISNRIETIQDARMAAGVALSLCAIYAERRALPRMDEVISRLRRRSDMGSATTRPFLAMVDGYRAASAGQLDAACEHVEEGIRLIVEQGDGLMVDQWLPVQLHMALRAGHDDMAAAVVASIRALAAFEEDDKLQGLVLRAQAVRLHAGGDVVAARAQLLEAARLLPIGRWNAYVKLDAAWLHIECGDAVTTRHLLRDLKPWLDEHPVGWLTLARFNAANGRWAEACEGHARYLLQAPPARSADLGLLEQIYRRGAQRDVVDVPPTSCLPTLC